MAKRKGRNAREWGEGTVFHDPTRDRWVAQISLGSDTNGKRVRKKRTAQRRVDAVALLKQMLREADLAPANAASPRTVAAYLAGWLEDVKASRADGTYQSYRIAVEKHIVPHLGKIRFNSIKPVHIKRWITSLESIGSRARQNAFKVLRSALNDAVRMRILPENPTDSFDAPSHRRSEIDPFTAHEASAIVECFEGSEWHLFAMLGFGCGLRQGEILGLQWGDLVNGQLRIERQQVEHGGKIQVIDPKSESSRRLVPVVDDIADQWNAARGAALELGRAGRNQPVFVGPRGGRLRRQNFRTRQWKPTLAAMGFQYRSPHQMRHTYATIALGAGVSIAAVSRILGHSKTSITLDVYGHAMPSDMDQAKKAAAQVFRAIS